MRGRIAIYIDEASNGQIITIGDTVRIVHTDANLAEEIAAAMVEAKLK